MYRDRSSADFSEYGECKKYIKKIKVSIFRIHFALREAGGPLLSTRATVFEGTACQPPRCRNVIYDGVHIWKFHLTTCTHVYHAAGPAERAQWPRMRKQLPVQSCPAILVLTCSPDRNKDWWSQKIRLGDFRPWDTRARVRYDGFFNEHGYCAPIIRE